MVAWRVIQAAVQADAHVVVFIDPLPVDPDRPQGRRQVIVVQ